MTSDVLADQNVSRETLESLRVYAALLQKWNARINLVAPSTLRDLWHRHIIDSAQLFRHAPNHARHWVDLGSGGGLPGVVCAILAREAIPGCRFTLIESDKRKSAFLTVAARELDLPFRVLSERIEAVPPQNADVISARALAPLPRLLAWVTQHLSHDGVALLHKGKNHNAELVQARHEWQFEHCAIESQTDSQARLLILKEITRV